MTPDPWKLLELAEAANIPKVSHSHWNNIVLFYVGLGWVVHVFYDVDEFDYIDSVTPPVGPRLEVWPDEGEQHWQKVLQEWRGPGDLPRVREFFKEVENGS